MNTNTATPSEVRRPRWDAVRRALVRLLPSRGLRLRVRATSFAAARALYRYPLRPATAGLALSLLGLLLLHFTRTHHAGRTFTGVGVSILVCCTTWWWLRWVARPHGVKAVIRRRAELDQRSAGTASRLDIAEHASAKALRLKAHVLRPSLRDLSARQQRRVPACELGVEVARLGWGWWGEQIWSACEDATLRIGGPRTGKTLSLACHGLDAPGALITTSTRLDLAEMLHHARASRGRVHVFNPAGLGGLPSTVAWRVLSGCDEFPTAQRRAADLIPESFGEGERWDAQARRVLALLLHAAAISGRGMRDVTRWISDTSPKACEEVADALLSSTTSMSGAVDGGRERAAAARQFWATNDRTRTSITTTMATPLAWMSDDRARQLGDANPGDPALVDIAGLIQRGETLHLIGHEDQGALSPLIGALVAEIAHTARTLAATHYRGRLDPPLTMLLDEAALVCPVPLDRWTADMGGRGVTLHISVQSLSQLRQRWGTEGAGTILANVATFLVFGGSPAAADLRDISLLTGEHRMRVIGVDHDNGNSLMTGRGGRRAGRAGRGGRVDSDLDGEQRGEYRWVPVLSPAQIRALEPGQVVVMRRGLHTAVGWAPIVTNRRGWKQVSLIRDPATATGRRDRITVPSTEELEAMLRTGPDTHLDPARSKTVLREWVTTLSDRLTSWLVDDPTGYPSRADTLHEHTVAGRTPPDAGPESPEGPDRGAGV